MGQGRTRAAKSLQDVARATGRYSEGAFAFVREELEHAVQSIHGPMTKAQEVVARYMSRERIGLGELLDRRQRGALDPKVEAALEATGSDAPNRHVSGQDLCWALREASMRRWGLLAGEVLRRWGVTCTKDFGQIVFALVDNELMQKEPHDSISDFADVYDFDEALKESYHIGDEVGG